MAEGIELLNWAWARALRFRFDIDDHPARHLHCNETQWRERGDRLYRSNDTGYEYNYPRRRRCTALAG